ncbi:MAG TPA: glutathione S-transferase family protein [Gammaproteobacteria bacterium]|nr:glutathione S-transferase family protein [Gammaproteobacteria bacterium]
MGRLIEGKWHDVWYDTEKHGGRFVREHAGYREWVRADGSTPFRPAKGRYHLYVSWACPWAHRTLILRRLKKLEDVIDVSVVHWFMRKDGWTFRQEDGATGDRLYGSEFLWQVYTRAKPDYTGRVTVPVLWDKESETIVNNESADIIRMLNSEFDEFGDPSVDMYPEPLREEIDEINAYVYDRVNNGVYKAGFATEQAAYEEAFDSLFEALDVLERRLEGQEYLVGNRLTEADWRLFTTLVRFDAVYYSHFKCNLRRIRDYPNLHAFLHRLLAIPGIAETVNMHHIKHHYYGSHDMINPTGVVPKGPEPAC